MGTLHYTNPGCIQYVKEAPVLELSLASLYSSTDLKINSSILSMESPLYAKLQADVGLATMIPRAVETRDGGLSCTVVNKSVLQARSRTLGALCTAGSASTHSRQANSSGLLMYNTASNTHLPPALLSFWNAAQLSQAPTATVHSHPWPEGSYISTDAVNSLSSSLVFTCLLALAWSLLPAASVASLVKERADGMLTQMKLSVGDGLTRRTGSQTSCMTIYCTLSSVAYSSWCSTHSQDRALHSSPAENKL
jgi:hypothetical protein